MTSLYLFNHSCPVVRFWHWLSLGNNNATAVGDIIALLGFCGVIVSTFYASKNLRLAEQSIRASTAATRWSMKPVLNPEALDHWSSLDGTLMMKVTNIGNGPGAQIFWGCGVTSQTPGLNRFMGFSEINVPTDDIQSGGFCVALAPKVEETFSLDIALGKQYLLLINCLDVGGNICQTQFLFHVEHDFPTATSRIYSVPSFVELALEERFKMPPSSDPIEAGLAPWTGI
jgi:hypothetical protein